MLKKQNAYIIKKYNIFKPIFLVKLQGRGQLSHPTSNAAAFSDIILQSKNNSNLEYYLFLHIVVF